MAGVILRTNPSKEAINFYRTLGLDLFESQHGGPIHHEVKPVSTELIVEIYYATQRFSKDTLMIEVESLPEALYMAEAFDF